ncbi:MAG: hypothetical protein AAB593_00915 [Patescibacteria group bacterium]
MNESSKYNSETMPKSGNTETEKSLDLGTNIEKEKMIKAIKISTVFYDQKILEQIADTLISKGLISGFHIDNVISGYIYKGKKNKENQYSLEILLDANVDSNTKNAIKDIIKNTIGNKWDVPPIIEEKGVEINKELLGFIKRAEIEHKKYKKEKNLKLAVALSAFLAISSTIGFFTKKYFDEKEHIAIATEQAKSYAKINELEKKISHQISELENKITSGKLTIEPSDMAIGTSYKETAEILETIREVENEMRKFKN